MHDSAVLFQPSNEVFGVCPLPNDLTQTFGIPEVEASAQRPVDAMRISTFFTFESTLSQTENVSYAFLSRRQRAAFAIVPVHRPEERRLFDQIWA